MIEATMSEKSRMGSVSFSQMVDSVRLSKDGVYSRDDGEHKVGGDVMHGRC